MSRRTSSRRGPVGPASLRRVRLLALDVDGTLTDGAMYYGAEGEALKRFHTRDGHGLGALRRAGVELAIITAEDSPIAAARARKLGIARVHLGVKDKRPLLERIMAEVGAGPAETAYMGDDEGDLECLRLAAVSACPADAHPSAKAAARWVCRAAGGNGAVRELCDSIMAARAAGREG